VQANLFGRRNPDGETPFREASGVNDQLVDPTRDIMECEFSDLV
jgi:hypothetical protein